MNTKIISIVLCIALVLPVFACETVTEERRGTAIGAGVGGATGAIAGAAIGDSTTSAVVGGLLGALVGGAIGYYAYDRERDQDETARLYDYEPAVEGRVLNIEEASAVPQTVRPGEEVDLRMTYAVLTPSPGEMSEITEIREIRHDGQLVGRPTVTVDRAGGTYTSSIPLRLPRDAEPGVYQVTETIESDFGRDTRETSFTVTQRF